MIHVLKTDPFPFQRVYSGEKLFELRGPAYGLAVGWSIISLGELK